MTFAFIDISLYQVPGANGAAMTIPANAKAPDFTVAKARGIGGVFARGCNDVRDDPSCRLFIPAARTAGLETAGYTYIRPPRGSALLHADRLLAAIDASGGTSMPPMVDMEAFDGQNEWAGNRYVDWVLELVEFLHAKDGRVPLGYGGKWFLDPMTAPRQAEVVAAFESIIVPAYPHQPPAWPQQQWPLPPVDPAQWEQWARSTQGGDPGLPNGPTLPTGVQRLDAWQLSSMGDTTNYGWTTSHHLDLNVATDDAWARWTAPLTTPEVPPVETLYPVGYGHELVTMAELRRRHEPHMEPEFARRLFNWIQSKGGEVGIGGGRRTVQPSRPGFAPPGMSFHQDQNFADWTIWFSAVDLVARNGTGVHRAPGVAECPQQGSVEAARWGVHINTSESWHMQAVPQDGYLSWVNAGRKRPMPGYQIPGGTVPGPTPPPMYDNPEEDDVKRLVIKGQNTPSYYAWDGIDVDGIPHPDLVALGYNNGLYLNVDPVVIPDDQMAALLTNQNEG